MRKIEFLEILHERLSGLPPDERADVLDDYAAHFADGEAAGRSEEEVAAALGDPYRLARELRAEAGFRRWESRRTPGNFATAVTGFVILVAVDFILLLPLLFGLFLFTLIAGLLAAGLLIAGVFTVVAQLGPGFLTMAALEDILVGIALLGVGVGSGALLLWMTDAVVRLLAQYARVHYTVLNQGGLAA